MKKIGFFIGHESMLGRAELLCSTLWENTSLTRGHTLVAVLPAQLGLKPGLPGAELLTFDLPEAYRGLPFADKMFAAAAFERGCSDAYLWLDTDSCFFRDIAFEGGAGLYVNPVDLRNIGVLYGGELSPLWKAVYRYFGLDARDCSFVETTVTKQRIYPYYNVGMVAVRENRGLFGQVRRALIALLETDEVKEQLEASMLNRIFLHQAVFSCAVMKLYAGGAAPLPYGANEPLHLRAKNPNPLPLKDVRSIRYDNYFDTNAAPAPWQAVFQGREAGLKSHWYYPD